MMYRLQSIGCNSVVILLVINTSQLSLIKAKEPVEAPAFIFRVIQMEDAHLYLGCNQSWLVSENPNGYYLANRPTVRVEKSKVLGSV